VAQIKVQSRNYGTNHDLALHGVAYAALQPGDTIEITTISIDDALEMYNRLTAAQKAVTFFRWFGLVEGAHNHIPHSAH